MGIVNTKFVYFCPVDDDVTCEAITEQLSISVRAEFEIRHQLWLRDEEMAESW